VERDSLFAVRVRRLTDITGDGWTWGSLDGRAGRARAEMIVLDQRHRLGQVSPELASATRETLEKLWNVMSPEGHEAAGKRWH
jgi:hypothetical protein